MRRAGRFHAWGWRWRPLNRAWMRRGPNVCASCGRRTCAQCKAVFHVTTRPPRTEGVCDHCGGPLVQREDDRPEAVRVRMATYEKNTAPLAEYYRQRGLLLPIPAEGSPEEIFSRTVAALYARDGVTAPVP